MQLRSIAAALALLLPSLAAAQELKVAYATPRGIFVMNGRGSAVRRLTDDAMAMVSAGAWSPDGRQLLFYAFRKSDEDLGRKYDLPLHFPLYVMNADGSAQRRLLDVPVLPEATWSPDGTAILFTSAYEDRTTSSAYVLDFATGKARRLTLAHAVSAPSWSPDGRQITFAAPNGKFHDIFAINADGTNERRLTNLGMVARNPSWSPDGKRIAFVAAGWFVMNADGSGKKRGSRFAGSGIAWAPDGRHLLLVGNGSAAVFDETTQTMAALAPGSGPFLEASFAPDGRRVIVRTATKIQSINVNGSDLRTLTDDGGPFAVAPLPP